MLLMIKYSNIHLAILHNMLNLIVMNLIVCELQYIFLV